MKWLKIIALGMVVWVLSLVWLDINLVLTLPIAIGLVMAMLVYFLGHYVGQLRSEYAADHNVYTDLTGPMTLHHTRSIHSRPTRPMLSELHR